MAGVPEVNQETVAKYSALLDSICPDCKKILEAKMVPVMMNLNSRDSIRKLYAVKDLVKLQKKLGGYLCPTCFAKCRKEAGV